MHIFQTKLNNPMHMRKIILSFWCFWFSINLSSAQDPSSIKLITEATSAGGNFTDVKVYAYTTVPGETFEVNAITTSFLFNRNGVRTPPTNTISAFTITRALTDADGWDPNQNTLSTNPIDIVDETRTAGAGTATFTHRIDVGFGRYPDGSKLLVTNSRVLLYTVRLEKIGVVDGIPGGYFYMYNTLDNPAFTFGNVDVIDFNYVYEYSVDSDPPSPLTHSSPLPVTLVGFSVQNNNNKSANLSWTVTREYDASHYVLERSYDGKNFSVFAQVPAQNKTELYTYVLEDNKLQLNDGTTSTVYYRLTLMDLDGSSKIHGVRAVKFVVPGNKEQIKALPNPFVQSIQLTIPAPSAQGAWVSLSNANGQVVYSQQYALSKGRNLLQIEPKVTLNSGSYFLTVVLDNGTTYKQKLLRGNK